MDKGPFIQTYSGIHFHPLDPRPEDICIEDIAHHLSLINRYNGACAFPYSVAQHCCYVSDYCSDRNKLWGLLHDASEAYWSDIPSPIKHNIDLGQWPDLEAITIMAICDKFGISCIEPSEVKVVDKLILGNEHRWLMKKHFDLPYIDGLVIEQWSWQRAKNEFMIRFRGLYER